MKQAIQFFNEVQNNINVFHKGITMSKKQMQQAYGKELKALNNLVAVYIDSYISSTNYLIDVSNEIDMLSNVYDRILSITVNLVDCGEDYNKAYQYVNSFKNIARLIKKDKQC